ncbi:MAG: hypothetical protein K6E57_02245 [Fibrobacter sp.]|nr:hypothetical protein [Fibrobacter sp.]
MAKKKKFFKSAALAQANRGKEDRIRETLSQIVSGESRLLNRPDELFDTIAKGIDDIEDVKDGRLQLELLAWTLRADFVAFKAEDDEQEAWNDLFYDAGTFFVELATAFEDKDYVADLVHDLALRHVGGEGRSVVFLSLEEFLPAERAKALIRELIDTVSEVELENREDVLDAICDMADSIKDAEDFAKAALMKDPDKSNATLIDIANSQFMAGNIELAKQWLGDVQNPGNEDEEAYLDLLAAIADREGRKTDCVKIAHRLYETFPKVIHLARLCSVVPPSEVKSLVEAHAKFRSGDGLDVEFMQLMVSLKCYDQLSGYLDLFEKELTTQDAEVLNAISDTLEKDGQVALAKHIRDWTVEDAGEALVED